MSDDLDDAIPEEELEMALEDLAGKSTAGIPADRIEALTKRVVYLQKQLMALDGEGDRDATGASKVAKDLAEARRQLAEWKTQHEGRN